MNYQLLQYLKDGTQVMIVVLFIAVCFFFFGLVKVFIKEYRKGKGVEGEKGGWSGDDGKNMSCEQETVNRILKRAKSSALSLYSPDKEIDMSQYSPPGVTSLALALVNAYDDKYDLSSLMAAAIREAYWQGEKEAKDQSKAEKSCHLFRADSVVSSDKSAVKLGLLNLRGLKSTPYDPSFGQSQDGCLFSNDLLTRAKAPDWYKCPAGTIAYSHTGAHWTKVEDGKWYYSEGGSVDAPGNDALLVKMPVSSKPFHDFFEEYALTIDDVGQTVTISKGQELSKMGKPESMKFRYSTIEGICKTLLRNKLFHPWPWDNTTEPSVVTKNKGDESLPGYVGFRKPK